MFWISGRGNDGDPSFIFVSFHEDDDRASTDFWEENHGQVKEKMPIGEGELGWTLGVGGRRVAAVCATSRRKKKRRRRRRTLCWWHDRLLRSEINGANLVVKIVLGPSVVVCRLIFKETSAPKNIPNGKNVLGVLLLGCLYVYVV